MEWQSIETAPKAIVWRDRTPYGDLTHHYGKRILVCDRDEKVWTAKWWETTGSAGGKNASAFLADSGVSVSATHWMPLPEPPAER